MNLRSSELALLKEIRSNTRDKRIFVRCSTVIAHEAGLSHEAIAISLDIGLRSVHRYLQIYERHGVDGLVEFNTRDVINTSIPNSCIFSMKN